MIRPRTSSMVLVAAAVVLGPVLLFPQLVPGQLGTIIAVTAALAALAGAVLFVRSPLLTVITLGVSASLILGWWRAGPSSSALAHFTGVCGGLLAMSVVGAWCRTEGRVVAVLCSALLLGSATVIVGFLGTALPSAKFFGPDAVVRDRPALTLGVPGLDPDGSVNANAIGVLALLLLPLGGAALRAGRRSAAGLLLPVLGALATLLSAAVILLSQSRSAWIAAWLLVCVMACRIGTRWRPRLVALGAWILVTILALAGTQRFAGEVFSRTVNHARDTAARRQEIMGQGITAFRQAPWFGIGLNEFRHRYQVKPPSGWRVAHAHNIVLQTALDIGLVGLAWYGALVGVLLVWADRHAAHGPPVLAAVAAGAGLSLLGVHLFGAADAVALGAKVGALQWLAAGLILAAHGAEDVPVGPC